MSIENLTTKAELKAFVEREVLANSEMAVKTRQLQGLVPKRGTGNPNGVVVGNPGDLYVDESGVLGARMWFKEQGQATDQNWVQL